MGPQLNLTNGANSIDHNSAHTIIPFWVDDDRVNNDDGVHQYDVWDDVNTDDSSVSVR